ncbi:MAG: type I methionyl aminopeptidase [Oscillospiraceae bacterium]|jgi:methionyl aminopeptidase|nr:type I methionyl aminopeptidase [Oscillospiraceae bacterium]
MINLKTPEEIKLMRKAGRISALALKIGGEAVKPGVTTKYLDDLMNDFIVSQGAKPSFLGESGYPACACISINDEVIHTIPSSKCVIKNGDIVTIDVGACIDGFHGDNAFTFACGEISSNAQNLLLITKKALQIGIKAVKVGSKIGDIGFSIQKFVESNGYFVVKEYVGHGIGRSVHEDPNVPNYGEPDEGALIEEGLVIAIEPMVMVNDSKIIRRHDGWGVVTEDSCLSAHFEHTVAVTKQKTKILTDCSDF